MSGTVIDLIRHGEPEGGRRYRGQLDDPLSEKGWQQMWASVGDYSGWRGIVSSPLSRCAAFASALGDRLNIPVEQDARLMECGFGDWEGLLPEEICAKDPHRLFRFREDPVRHGAPGAEPLAAFHARVGECWRDLCARPASQHLLVVTHAGVIRMLLCHALGLPPQNGYRFAVGNAALTRIRLECEDGVLLPTVLFHDGRL